MTRQSVMKLALLLLLVEWALLAIGSRRVSLTMDEPAHIARGYAYLARGRAAFWYFPQNSHPPLLNVAEAVLLYASNPTVPLEELPGWGADFIHYAEAMIPYLLPLERSALLARMPIMLATLLLATLSFRWATDLAGPHAGLITLVVAVLDPLQLAHGRLSTTDAGLTALGTALMYMTWRWNRHPRWRHAVSLGALAGLTLLAKYSGVLYLLACGALFLWMLLSPKLSPHHGSSRMRIFGQMLLAALIAGSMVWVAYGFSIGPVVIGGHSFTLPAPEYWQALLNQASTADDRIAVLAGQIVFGSHWWYFPLNFVIRNPLPILLAFAGGVAAWFRSFRREWPIAVFPTLYAIVAVTTGMNVSYRHMLPVHPFLYLTSALGIVYWTQARDKTRPRQEILLRWGVVALGVWYAIGTLRVFPDELAYFNELVGGPRQAPRVLVDYSQDWGQAFLALRSYMETHPGPRPSIFYFTLVRPQHYDISCDRLESVSRFHPQPGRYVLGPAPLYGLVGSDPQQFDWFRHRPPNAFVAHSLFVYNVSTVVDWIAQCTVPVAPLNTQALEDGYGPPAPRQVMFDCKQSWVYPTSGTASDGIGSYVIHDQLLSHPQGSSLPKLLRPSPPEALDSFTARHLDALRLAYEQPIPGRQPAFAIYETLSRVIPPTTDAYAATIDQAPDSFQGNAWLPSTGHTLNGHLRFLGVKGYWSPNRSLDIETWWEVLDPPTEAPVSIFVHLITSKGHALAGADGWGVDSNTLHTGDIIVQRHALDNHTEDSGLWLRIGAYWLTDPATRKIVVWHNDRDPEATALFVPLTRVHITQSP